MKLLIFLTGLNIAVTLLGLLLRRTSPRKGHKRIILDLAPDSAARFHLLKQIGEASTEQTLRKSLALYETYLEAQLDDAKVYVVVKDSSGFVEEMQEIVV